MEHFGIWFGIYLPNAMKNGVSFFEEKKKTTNKHKCCQQILFCLEKDGDERP